MSKFGVFPVVFFLSSLCAAGSSVGVVVSDGSFLLNNSSVHGNATLLEGAVVETLEAPSRIRLDNGARIELTAGSKAAVYRDHLRLEKGLGELTVPAAFRVEAGALRISPRGSRVEAKVAVPDAKTVQVAAAAGALRVHNAAGILVSNVEAGSALEFETQVIGQAPPSSFIGCLLKKEGQFVVYDQTTRVIAELRGSGFEKEWGNRVQANGTARAGAQPDVQVLDVTSITRIETGGCDDVAQAIQAQLPGPAKPAPAVTRPQPAPTEGGGMSAGTKVAIISAIGGGAAGAVLATKKSRSK